VPEYRIHVHHEEEEEEPEDTEQGDDVPDEDADPSSNRSSNHFSRQETYETTSPRNSSTSNNIVIESEYQESPSAGTLTSPASSPQPTQSTQLTGQSDGPIPAPALLNGSRGRLEIPPLESVSTELNVGNGDLSKQGNEEPSSPSTWEKMMPSFMRTNSGRRSRSNSIAKREPLDTTVNRESENSLAMSKPEPSTPIHQSSSASASMTSFAPYTPTRGAPSPIPPATSADMHKYQDAKLFPFPGIHMLEQLRVKGPSASASVPDVANLRYSSNDDGPSQSFATSPSRTPDMTRERKLSHQASDTRLRGKCQFHSSRVYVT
jgi:serine/arginine repetitive matrix protein 2